MRSESRLIPVALLSLSLWGCGGGETVDVTHPQTGSISESFSEPAKTRLSNIYVLAMPVATHLEKIEWQPGDTVKAGQVLATLDLVPLQSEREEAQAKLGEIETEIARLEDQRLEQLALEGAEAEVRASAAAQKAALAQVQIRAVRAARKEKDLERFEALAKQRATTTQQLEEARFDVETARIELREGELDRAAYDALHLAIGILPRGIRTYLDTQKLDRKILEFQRNALRARLRRLDHHLNEANVIAPIDGIILARLEDGGRHLSQGTPLLRVGDLSAMEVIAEVLTEDAQTLSPGTAVSLRIGASDAYHPAKVVRVSPEAFTKVSSLGVEQQRVEVVIQPESGFPVHGHGFRVVAQFLTAEKKSALRVPRSSVYEGPSGDFRVLVTKGQQLEERKVKLGLRSNLWIEVTEGLTAKDLVVVAASRSLKPGSAINPVVVP